MELQGSRKRIAIMFVTIFGLLMIPLIAMQFTEEVDWQRGDFLIMGIMLSMTFLLIEILIRAVKNQRYKALLIAIVVIMFLLTWAELGVGIFGTPFAGD